MLLALSYIEANGFQGQQPSRTTPAPTVHQQVLSALQKQAQRLSAWEQFFFISPFFNCSSSSILTQDFIAPSGKGITPDSLLTGVGQMCMCAQQSVNNDDVSVLKHKFYWQLEC